MSLHPQVSIGLPTYNRPALLERAIAHFLNQPFANIELIVSDNASSDPRVQSVCEAAAARDPRVRYVRQATNMGPEKNFWFVFEQVRAPFFMWAADDDLWPDVFIPAGMEALEKDPRASAWFCQVENVNAKGELFRQFPPFRRYQRGGPKSAFLARFLFEPEVMGKANLLYALFRREALKPVVEHVRKMPTVWGYDMTIVYAFLCRYDILIDDGILFKKQVDTLERDWQVPEPRRHIYPWDEARAYLSNYALAARGTRHLPLTVLSTVARYLYDVHYHRRWFQAKAPWWPPARARRAL